MTDEQQRRVVGYRRTDNRPIPDEYVITSDTNPDDIDHGDWEPVYADEESGAPPPGERPT